jgi:hypothetical protein
MLRFAGICAVFVATGCMVSSEGDDSYLPTGQDLLGRVCTMQMTITGTFTQSMEPPENANGEPYTGCWPIGTWTFRATRGETDCSGTPQLLEQYQFKVDYRFDDDGNQYQSNTYMTDPTVRHRVKVSQGGAGLCQGELNLFSSDGKEVWIIKPSLYADGTLRGDGEYALYKDDQWLGDP